MVRFRPRAASAGGRVVAVTGGGRDDLEALLGKVRVEGERAAHHAASHDVETGAVHQTQSAAIARQQRVLGMRVVRFRDPARANGVRERLVVSKKATLRVVGGAAPLLE